VFLLISFGWLVWDMSVAALISKTHNSVFKDAQRMQLITHAGKGMKE